MLKEGAIKKLFQSPRRLQHISGSVHGAWMNITSLWCHHCLIYSDLVWTPPLTLDNITCSRTYFKSHCVHNLYCLKNLFSVQIVTPDSSPSFTVSPKVLQWNCKYITPSELLQICMNCSFRNIDPLTFHDNICLSCWGIVCLYCRMDIYEMCDEILSASPLWCHNYWREVTHSNEYYRYTCSRDL